MTELNTNREIKDSVFVDLFGKDETAPQNFLSLYNALHDTHLTIENTELKQEMIDSVMYMTYANDVAMRINGKVVVLIEHQSTINNNMPLRLLDYITRIYDRIIPSRDKFKRKMIEIPFPEFYVLYNGTEKTEPYFEKRLSEAFMRDRGDTSLPTLELVVKVYNINTDIGNELLDKCSVLKQYSELIDLVRDTKRNAEKENIDSPFTRAIQEAVKRGILSEYLERKAAEVINMFNVEYDYNTDIEVQREEAQQQGSRVATLSNIRDFMAGTGWSANKVMDMLHIPEIDRAQYITLL